VGTERDERRRETDSKGVSELPEQKANEEEGGKQSFSSGGRERGGQGREGPHVHRKTRGLEKPARRGEEGGKMACGILEEGKAAIASWGGTKTSDCAAPSASGKNLSLSGL